MTGRRHGVQPFAWPLYARAGRFPVQPACAGTPAFPTNCKLIINNYQLSSCFTQESTKSRYLTTARASSGCSTAPGLLFATSKEDDTIVDNPETPFEEENI
jgi:hypothetical protein